jgi:hypothetical protein
MSDAQQHGGKTPRALAESGARLFLVAGTASALTKTGVAPLDRLRIIAQTGLNKGPLADFRRIVQQEGVRGLWKGNLANSMRIFPSRGILFACNDLYKVALKWVLFAGGSGWSSSGSSSSAPRKVSGNGGSDLPVWASFLAGSLAGLTSNGITYPLDHARTQVGRPRAVVALRWCCAGAAVPPHL